MAIRPGLLLQVVFAVGAVPTIAPTRCAVNERRALPWCRAGWSGAGVFEERGQLEPAVEGPNVSGFVGDGAADGVAGSLDDHHDADQGGLVGCHGLTLGPLGPVGGRDPALLLRL